MQIRLHITGFHLSKVYCHPSHLLEDKIPVGHWSRRLLEGIHGGQPKHFSALSNLKPRHELSQVYKSTMIEHNRYCNCNRQLAQQLKCTDNACYCLCTADERLNNFVCMRSSSQPKQAGDCQMWYANSGHQVDTARRSLLRLAQEASE